MIADQKVVVVGALRSIGAAVLDGYRKRVYHVAGTSRSIASSAHSDYLPIRANVSGSLTDRLGSVPSSWIRRSTTPFGGTRVNADGVTQPVQENASANKSHCLPVTFPTLSKKLAR
jgi:hypothetical protein